MYFCHFCVLRFKYLFFRSWVVVVVIYFSITYGYSFLHQSKLTFKSQQWQYFGRLQISGAFIHKTLIKFETCFVYKAVFITETVRWCMFRQLIKGVSPSRRYGSSKRSGIMQDSTGSVTVDGEHPEDIPLDEMGKLYRVIGYIGSYPYLIKKHFQRCYSQLFSPLK